MLDVAASQITPPMRTKLRPITAHLHFLRSWPRMSVAATSKRIRHVNGQRAEAYKLGIASEKYRNRKARAFSGFHLHRLHPSLSQTHQDSP